MPNAEARAKSAGAARSIDGPVCPSGLRVWPADRLIASVPLDSVDKQQPAWQGAVRSLLRSELPLLCTLYVRHRYG